MDRIGRFTVILATVALPWFEPSACRASPQPLCRRLAPGPANDFDDRPGHQPAPVARVDRPRAPPRAWPVAQADGNVASVDASAAALAGRGSTNVSHRAAQARRRQPSTLP